MAMNFWATIEHSLQYKYKGDMPEHVAERVEFLLSDKSAFKTGEFEVLSAGTWY